MDLELTILGANSAIPLINKNPTAQFLTIHNRHFLIDCGEGTQVRLRENNIGFGRIDHILISHLHGDHFFGLAPLLSTLNLLDRQKELHIYAPKGLQKLVQDQIKIQGSWLKYPLLFHDLNFKEKTLLFEDEKVKINSFPLNHRIKCCGFLFEEKPLPRRIRSSAIKEYDIPVIELKRIKTGSDFENESGQIISNKSLTLDPYPSLSYAYCTDTTPIENLDSFFSDPSLMYHEATFIDKHKEKALQTFHSTTIQAADMATKVKAVHLLIGHFSARYTDLEELLLETKSKFENSWIAKERTTFTLKHTKKDLIVKSNQ